MDTDGCFRVQQDSANHPERDVKIRPTEERGEL